MQETDAHLEETRLWLRYAQGDLRAAVQMAPPEPRLEAVAAHPLAAWLEETFGLDEEYGRLVRRAPLTFVEGLRRLVEATGLDEDLCRWEPRRGAPGSRRRGLVSTPAPDALSALSGGLRPA